MSTTELKDKIINSLQKIEDNSLLTDVYNLLNKSEKNSIKYFVSDIEKEYLEEALKDIEDGKTYSDIDAKEIMKEWLKK
jgi:phage terminase Nu1 subunit (DNA packaging protein)